MSYDCLSLSNLDQFGTIAASRVAVAGEEHTPLDMPGHDGGSNI